MWSLALRKGRPRFWRGTTSGLVCAEHPYTGLRRWLRIFNDAWQTHIQEGLPWGTARKPWELDPAAIRELRDAYALEWAVAEHVRHGHLHEAEAVAGALGRGLHMCELHMCGVRAMERLGSAADVESAAWCFLSLGRYGQVELEHLIRLLLARQESFHREAGAELGELQASLRLLLRATSGSMLNQHVAARYLHLVQSWASRSSNDETERRHVA